MPVQEESDASGDVHDGVVDELVATVEGCHAVDAFHEVLVVVQSEGYHYDLEHADDGIEEVLRAYLAKMCSISD